MLVFVSKGLYKLKGARARKNLGTHCRMGWVIDKVLPYNMGHSARALMLVLRYFNYIYEM
jgi:hypothetical protein